MPVRWNGIVTLQTKVLGIPMLGVVMNKDRRIPAPGKILGTAVDALGAFIEEHIAAFQYHFICVALKVFVLEMDG